MKKEKENLVTKNDLLTKLRAYSTNPDDDVIRIKKDIYRTFLQSPELLYAMNDDDLSKELFDDDGNINWEWNEEKKEYEPLGEWDRYFGEKAPIRPMLFIPDTQTDVKNYLCYQVGTDDTVRYNFQEKKVEIVFTILVHENNTMDKETGIPRHDLISSIVREKFAWIGTEIPTPTPIYNKESIVDNHYVVRTIKYQAIIPNDISKTINGVTQYSNKRW